MHPTKIRIDTIRYGNNSFKKRKPHLDKLFRHFELLIEKAETLKTEYRTLIEAGDRAGLLAALTRTEVEEKILKRVADKVEHIQAEINPTVRRRIPSEEIMAFYRNSIIPLTKEGQVRYFLNRQIADTFR